MVLLRALRALPGAHTRPSLSAALTACLYCASYCASWQRVAVPSAERAEGMPAAQETRTLAFNNVVGGTWHGPSRFVLPEHAPAPMAAPALTLATKA